MRYHNPNTVPMTFEIGGTKHAVAPGAEIDVPAALAYAIKLEGIRLADGPAPTPVVVEPTKATTPKPETSRHEPAKGRR